jgi:hypothetical protein
MNPLTSTGHSRCTMISVTGPVRLSADHQQKMPSILSEPPIIFRSYANVSRNFPRIKRSTERLPNWMMLQRACDEI